jgi:hypothetical protein
MNCSPPDVLDCDGIPNSDSPSDLCIWTKGLEFQIEYCLNLVVSIESLNYSWVKCELAIRFGTVAFLRWR